LSTESLVKRSARLEDVVAGSELVFPMRRLAPDGLEAWGQVIERGYEGYVAKDEASVYESGPTRRWLKVKVPDWTVEGDGWRRRISVAPPGPLTVAAPAEAAGSKDSLRFRLVQEHVLNDFGPRPNCSIRAATGAFPKGSLHFPVLPLPRRGSVKREIRKSRDETPSGEVEHVVGDSGTSEVEIRIDG
jgi:hypothetical protein